MWEYDDEPTVCQPPASEVTFWPPLNNEEKPPAPNFDVLARHTKSLSKLRRQGKNNGEIQDWLRKKGLVFPLPDLITYFQNLAVEQEQKHQKEQQQQEQKKRIFKRSQTKAHPSPDKTPYLPKTVPSQNPPDGPCGVAPRGGILAVVDYAGELVQMRRHGDHIAEMLCFLRRKHVHATAAEVTRVLEIHHRAVTATEAEAEKEQLKRQFDQIRSHIGDLLRMRGEGKDRCDMIEWLGTNGITACGADLNLIFQEHEEAQKQKQEEEQHSKPAPNPNPGSANSNAKAKAETENKSPENSETSNPLELVGSLRPDVHSLGEGSCDNRPAACPPMASGNANAARTLTAPTTKPAEMVDGIDGFLIQCGISVDKVDAFLEGRPPLKLEKAIEIGKYHAVHTFSSPASTVQEVKAANQTLSIAAAYEEAQARAAYRQQILKLREAAHELRIKKMAQVEARAMAAAERKTPKTFDNTARIAAFRKEYFKDVFTPENIALVKQAFAKAGIPWVSVPDDPDYVPPAGQPTPDSS